MNALRIGCPFLPSNAGSVSYRIDSQPKFEQIAAVVARVAISTIAAIAAFVFLPLPSSLVIGATLVIANIAACFCKCPFESQRTQRLYNSEINDVKPRSVSNPDEPTAQAIPQPASLRINTNSLSDEDAFPGSEELLERRQNAPTQLPLPPSPSSSLKTESSSLSESHSSLGIAEPEVDSSLSKTGLAAESQTLPSDPLGPCAIATQAQSSIRSQGSEIPSQLVPSDVFYRAVAPRDSIVAKSASARSHLPRTSNSFISHGGYRTLIEASSTGPVRRKAISLTSASQAASALVQNAEAPSMSIPGYILENDVTV